MYTMRFNKLLERQIKKYLPEDVSNQEYMSRFLQAVQDSYDEYERDCKLFNHASALNEKEYIKINEKLKGEVRLKEASIQKLKQTINRFKGSNAFLYHDTEDLSDVIGFLEQELEEKKKSDDLLKQSEKRLRLALQMIDDNVWEYNFPNRTMTFALNEKSILNLDKNEFADKENLIWWDAILEEDREIAVETFRRYMHGEITKHCIEYRVKDKNGSVKWVLNRGGVISRDKDGKPITVIGTLTDIDHYKTIQDQLTETANRLAHDITERKRSELKLKRQEEKYRSIIANMNLGLVEVDLQENIRFVNHSFCLMSGYKEEELIGKNASDLFVQDDFKEMMKSKNLLRLQGQSYAYEMSPKTKDGETRWWLISAAPLYNDKQHHIGSIGIHLDITHQKLLAEQLLEAKQLAERSSRAKDLFLANMSHEIRTPMNAILGMSRQLQKTILNPQQQSYLDIIGTAAENLLVIINDILDFSKLEAGKVTLEDIGFNMHDLITNTSRVLKLKAEEKGLIFEVCIADNVAHFLKGDPYRVNQVLMNLLSNSIKFTSRGRVSLQCRLIKDNPDSQELEIIICDTGKGMDESYLKNLFNKFSQEDESIARSYGGTGLGMSIVKQLIELMNGSITVESKKGEGTQVYVHLSFMKCVECEHIKKENITIEAHTLTGKKILLVEDNEMNRVVAETILSQYGATITEAVNGADAVDALRNNRFDIVLMDIQMPVMDGLEATQIIRRDLRLNTPIIALTANAVKGEMEKCIQSGMNDYLSKPFEEEDLIRLIAKWLGRETHFATAKENTVTATPLYDINKLKQITRGDEQFMQKMLELFIKETTNSVSELNTALKVRDIKRLQFLAHRMKSALGNLSVASAVDIAQKIEKSEWAEPDYPALDELACRFKSIIDEVITSIKSHYFQPAH
jgi:PAS domain S-box-containing protein